jgi:hypothetical protein
MRWVHDAAEEENLMTRPVLYQKKERMVGAKGHVPGLVIIVGSNDLSPGAGYCFDAFLVAVNRARCVTADNHSGSTSHQRLRAAAPAASE